MPSHRRRFSAPAALTVAWLAAVAFVVVIEGRKIEDRLVYMATTGDWWGSPVPDATFVLPVLLLAPLCWLFPCRCLEPASDHENLSTSSPSVDPPLAGTATGWKVIGAVFVAVLSLAVSVATSLQIRPGTDPAPFGDAVPSIHDEFSYLLQARSYLAGRWWWPGPDRAPELFHQMHVLNEGRFASRYFPGVGAWIAPFLAIGHPVWGHWLAGMLIAAFVFAIGCRAGDGWVGLIAGTLTALSPGMAIFSNLLLGHHPALVGLGLFLWAFLHLMEQPRLRWGLASGAGLSFAMLCRPLTAASVALPFGLWLVAQITRDVAKRDLRARPWRWLPSVAGLALPLALGFAAVGIQNRAITGNVLSTPYGLYTRLYTPRHVYGFHNGIRGDSNQGPKVLREYDQWALDLTPELAIRNLRQRVQSSFEWTLGITPLAMAGLIFLSAWGRNDIRWRLMFAAIIALHLLHLPYWLDGILHYHYVFESGPLWLLLLARVSVALIREAQQLGRYLFLPWWLAFIGMCVTVNHLPVSTGNTVPRVRTGIEQVIQDPAHYRALEEAVTESVTFKPALVLVKIAPEALHVEFIRNHPPFDADVLVGRYDPRTYAPGRLQELFPERTLYVYDTDSRSIRLLANEE